MPNTGTDTGVSRRLQAMVTQVFDVVNERGTLRGIGAGLRSWKRTERTGATDVAIIVTKQGVAVVLVVALGAASVASFGALPIGTAIAALAGLLGRKLFKLASHSRDVKQMLEFIKRGVKEDVVQPLDWEMVKPTLEPSNVKMAEVIFKKLIIDVQNLETEVDALLKSSQKPSNADARADAIAFLLNEERGPRRRTSTVEVHDLSKPSEQIEGEGNRVVHRLRRLRFYLRWLANYVKLLEEATFEAIDEATAAEKVVMDAALMQVGVQGKHDRCGKVCFGPVDTDFVGGQQISLPPASSTPVSEKFEHMTPLAYDTRNLGASDVPGFTPTAAEKEAQARQQKSDKAVDKVIGKVTEPLKNEIIGAVTRIAGVIGEWVGNFVGDAIRLLVAQAREWYRVRRPLEKRVAMVKQAMQENDPSALDPDVVALAKENDLKAVLQAFLLVHSHYPKEIERRTKKLEKLLRDMQTAAAKGAKSPFETCTGAAEAVRYLAKVYHQSEKQLVHILFVKFALEAIDRKIFREPYKRPMQPAFEDIERFDLSTLKHVETRQFDPVAFQREQNKKELLEKWERVGTEATRLLESTYVNALPFQGGGFREGRKEAQLASRALTMQEWLTVSNVRLRKRSKLTVEVDDALRSYLPELNRLMTEARGPKRDLRKKAVVDRLIVQLKDRAMKALQVRNAAAGWEYDKQNNVKSARRFAVLQLKDLMCAEFDEFERAAKTCEIFRTKLAAFLS